MGYTVVQTAEADEQILDIPLQCCPYALLSSWLEPLNDEDVDEEFSQ